MGRLGSKEGKDRDKEAKTSLRALAAPVVNILVVDDRDQDQLVV